MAMVSTTNTSKASLFIVAIVCLQSQCTSFTPKAQSVRRPTSVLAAAASPSSSNVTGTSHKPNSELRRSILTNSIAATLGCTVCLDAPNVVTAADGKLDIILDQIKEARDQLASVPDLIQAEKWDAVRAILVKPPLSNMWTSGGQNKLLNNYADAIGNELPDGDEIGALELREEVISHLRYLDMAVYNNVFNPIGTEGQSGATKELVRSYYEDPINEWKASKLAIDGLIGLASP